MTGIRVGDGVADIQPLIRVEQTKVKAKIFFIFPSCKLYTITMSSADIYNLSINILHSLYQQNWLYCCSTHRVSIPSGNKSLTDSVPPLSYRFPCSLKGFPSFIPRYQCLLDEFLSFIPCLPCLLESFPSFIPCIHACWEAFHLHPMPSMLVG